MTEELGTLIPEFPGEANRGRCFLHITNLVAKSLLKLFDLPKKKAEQAASAAEHELLELAQGIEMEEAVAIAEQGAGGDDEDDIEGYVDELLAMDEGDRLATNEAIQPVRTVLVKVSLRARTFSSISHICTAS